jgi:hypothetical protein
MSISIFFLLAMAFMVFMIVLGKDTFKELTSTSLWILPLFLSIFFNVIDVFGILEASQFFRYLPHVFVLLSLILLRHRYERSIDDKSFYFFASMLSMYTIAGSLYGRFYLETLFGAIPIAVMIAFLAIRPPKYKTEIDIHKAFTIISATSSMIGIGATLVRLGVLPLDSLKVYSHEKSFIMLLAITTAIAIQKRILILLSIFSALASFALYPAATYLLVILAWLLTRLWIKAKPNFGVRFVVANLTITLVFLSALNYSVITGFFDRYFSVVGKGNNSSYREMLFQLALSKVYESPLLGSLFTSDVVVTTNYGRSYGIRVPIHNDYMTILVGGGLFALGLFLFIVFKLNGAMLTNALAGSSTESRRAIIALVVPINSAFLTLFVNPILLNAGSGLVLSMMVFTAMLLMHNNQKINFNSQIKSVRRSFSSS